jgi:hypothetical protein
MSKHPEDKVLDVIDQLVDESLKKPKDDYHQPFSEACHVCGYEWHGATNGLGCPGVFATDEQAATWRARVEEHWRDDVRKIMGLTDDEIAELPEAFVDIGFVDQTSHDDSVPDEETGSDQDICDLDTLES